MPVSSFHHSQVKLGKKEAIHDDRALLFGNYLKADILPYIPQAYHWGAQVPHWPLYLNSTLGCCVEAATFHHEGVWTFKTTGTELIVPDSEVISSYETAGGYVPGDPSTDNGTNMLTMVKLWKSQGFVSGDKLLAYTSLEPGNNTHVMASTFLFGGVFLGIQLPITAQAQSKPNGIWSLVPGYLTNEKAQRGSWGGHCVALHGYNQQMVCLTTWGFVQYATWQWLRYYMDEAFSPMSTQWMNTKGVAPNHFNLSQLQEDLTLIT